MGCGETLFLGQGGHVTCGYLPCPNPSRVTQLLDQFEGRERYLIAVAKESAAMTPGEALAEVRQALDGGMGGMDDTAAWWYERVQVLAAEFDQLCRAASNAERYLATLPGDPEPGDPRMVNIWAALRKAVRPYEREAQS